VTSINASQANQNQDSRKEEPMKTNSPKLFAAAFGLALFVSTGAALADSATATGKVQKIDGAASKVTIKHGPIKTLDMPDPMTMVYPVKDPAMLKAIKAGDDVTFDVDQGSSGYVITRIQKK
jgi:Cu(I)/Ag(I) efflux system protein CusF